MYGDASFDINTLLATNGGSSGNGYRHNGGANGGNRDAPSRAKAAPETGTPGTQPSPLSTPHSALRIVLDETDDEDGDQERLRALLATLVDYSGDAEARLSIRQRNGEEVVMELPPVRACAELTQRLGDIVGPWGAVAE
jgi:hypothetical protein